MKKEPLQYSIRQKVLAQHKITYGFILTLTMVWCFLFVVTPILCDSNVTGKKAGALIWLFFGATCHQMAERSFHLFGHPFAVCARCTGIYFGFLLGTILYPFFKKWENHALPSWKWLFWAALPAGLEFILSKIGLLHVGLIPRSISGIIIGGTVAFFIIPALFDLIKTPNKKARY
jgi:uncharacterized membrane protein